MITGSETCCAIHDNGAECENLARWCYVDGVPAYDHYTELCDACLADWCGDDMTGVSPLIPGKGIRR